MSFSKTFRMVHCDRHECKRKTASVDERFDGQLTPFGVGWVSVTPAVREGRFEDDDAHDEWLRTHVRHWCPKCWPVVADLLKEHGALP